MTVEQITGVYGLLKFELGVQNSNCCEAKSYCSMDVFAVVIGSVCCIYRKVSMLAQCQAMPELALALFPTSRTTATLLTLQSDSEWGMRVMKTAVGMLLAVLLTMAIKIFVLLAT